MRKFQFQIGQYYHIYNRGVEARDIFTDDFDYLRFLRSRSEFNRLEAGGGLYIEHLRNKTTKRFGGFGGLTSSLEVKPLVEFIAYCLNPNHFHFLLRQAFDNGIKTFLHKLGT